MEGTTISLEVTEIVTSLHDGPYADVQNVPIRRARATSVLIPSFQAAAATGLYLGLIAAVFSPIPVDVRPGSLSSRFPGGQSPRNTMPVGGIFLTRDYPRRVFCEALSLSRRDEPHTCP